MLTQKTAKRVFSRDGSMCSLCGSCTLLVVHHRVNRGMGGWKAADRPSNYLTLCAPCNSAIEANHPSAERARRRGIKVSKHYDLARLPSVPVTDCWGRKWLLDDQYQRVEVKA